MYNHSALLIVFHYLSSLSAFKYLHEEMDHRNELRNFHCITKITDARLSLPLNYVRRICSQHFLSDAIKHGWYLIYMEIDIMFSIPRNNPADICRLQLQKKPLILVDKLAARTSTDHRLLLRPRVNTGTFIIRSMCPVVASLI